LCTKWQIVRECLEQKYTLQAMYV